MSEYFKGILLFYHVLRRLGHVRVVKISTFMSQKRRIIMTQTQNNWWANQETKRHNQRLEEINMLEFLENQRAHKAQEANARYAADVSAAASRYGADQSLAGNTAKAESTKYSADVSAATSKSNKRLEVTANAAQKEADRELSRLLNSVNADIQRDTNSIKRDANAITKARNENDFQIAKDKLAQQLDELKLKWDQFDFSKDRFTKEYGLDLVKHGLDERKFSHQKWEDFWRDTRDTTDTVVNGIDKLTRSIVNLRYGADFSDVIKQVRTISNALGGNNNG